MLLVREMCNILVTGSDGFIGKELARLDSTFRKVTRRVKKHYDINEIYLSSIDGDTDWTVALEGIDVVIHLASVAHGKGVDTSLYQSVNVDGTLRLAEEAVKANVKRLVFVSSIGVNGCNTYDKPFSPESSPNPSNDYSYSKYQAEIGLKCIANKTGLEVVIVRPTLVYGPKAPGNFGLLTKLVHHTPVLPFGSTSNRRDFISVENLSDLLITCAHHINAAGHTFIASEGETVSTKEFTNAIAFGLGKRLYQLPVPVSIMRVLGMLLGRSNMIEQLYGNLEVDSSSLRCVLGWSPPYSMMQSMERLKEDTKC